MSFLSAVLPLTTRGRNPPPRFKAILSKLQRRGCCSLHHKSKLKHAGGSGWFGTLSPAIKVE